MSEKDYIKQAEQNAINRSRYFCDVIKVLDLLGRFGNAATREHVGRKEFFDGLGKIRNAVYAEYVDAMKDCFMFVGVGGVEALEYSKEKFEEHFGEDRYLIMNFLDQWGQLPGSWSGKVEEEFKKQAKEKIENNKKAVKRGK